MTSARRHFRTPVFPFRATLFLVAATICSAQLYTISTVAGGGPPLIASAASTPFGGVGGVATDLAGNVWLTGGNCVFRLDPHGAITRVAGNSRAGYSGDGGPAIDARLNFPVGVAVDSTGNLFIADTGNTRIRRVSPDGIITTVAGNGLSGVSVDGGPAASSPLLKPTSIAVDSAGALYIGEDNFLFGGAATSRVRKVTTDGIIHSVATNLPINGVRGVAVDSAGNLFIADWGNSRVLKISPDGSGDGSSTVAAGGGLNWTGDGGSATAARLIRPASVAVDGAGNLFIGDAGQIPQGGYLASVRKVSPGGIITTLAGGGQVYPPAPAVPLSAASGVATDFAGNLFVADGVGILKLSGSGTAVRVAGSDLALTPSPGDGSLATSVQLQLAGVNGVAWQSCLALDGAGNLYISENAFHRVRKVSVGGTIATVAGTGASGSSGDGGPATDAQLSGPAAVATDASGNLFIADSAGSRIRKVSAHGVITTVAVGQFSVSGMAADNSGNLFLADSLHYQVWKLSTTGILTPVAGTGERGISGDGGPATSALLSYLTGLAVDAAGNLYLSDSARIRRVSTEGIITTVAGDAPDLIGNGVPATTAPLGGGGLAIDKTGNLFLADYGGNRVRKISRDGIVTTIAGNGNSGYSGDGGPATSAQVRGPYGIAVDNAGGVYVADTLNNAIRLLQPTNQMAMVGAIVDAASESIRPLSAGKIAILYGAGLGPSPLTQFQTNQNGVIATQLAGTSVLFNGVPAPVLYSSATQVAVIAPYGVSGETAGVTVTYQGQPSAAFRVSLAAASPAIFTLNQTGAGQAAAVNLDGTMNTAANPVKIGDTISLYATGEGQTSPAGVDGKLAAAPLPHPVLPVTVTIDGHPANVTYYGAAPGQVAGLMQVNVQIPRGVRPGGYVPAVLQVGAAASQPGVTIAVSLN